MDLEKLQKRVIGFRDTLDGAQPAHPKSEDGGPRTGGFASGWAVPRSTEVRMAGIRGHPDSSRRFTRRNIPSKKQEAAPSRTRELDRGTSD